jgi:hypothetical protein
MFEGIDKAVLLGFLKKVFSVIENEVGAGRSSGQVCRGAAGYFC